MTLKADQCYQIMWKVLACSSEQLTRLALALAEDECLLYPGSWTKSLLLLHQQTWSFTLEEKYIETNLRYEIYGQKQYLNKYLIYNRILVWA